MKQKVKLIVAATDNGAIGRSGGLIFNCKEDMRQFREKTSGGVVVMGSRTYESLNRKDGLPNRVNYVVGSKTGRDGKNLVFVNSVEEALHDAELNHADREVWVIGGGQIYRYCLEHGLIDEMHVTWFHKVVEDASTWFPMPQPTEWRKVEASGYFDENLGFGVTFEVLEKVK